MQRMIRLKLRRYPADTFFETLDRHPRDDTCPLGAACDSVIAVESRGAKSTCRAIMAMHDQHSPARNSNEIPLNIFGHRGYTRAFENRTSRGPRDARLDAQCEND